MRRRGIAQHPWAHKPRPPEHSLLVLAHALIGAALVRQLWRRQMEAPHGTAVLGAASTPTIDDAT